MILSESFTTLQFPLFDDDRMRNTKPCVVSALLGV